ncbi:tRNA (adenosine(37)-N6)-threonylcarbamoyltransferase complex ATPase subunit type 1 TsaE [Bradyrhizobium sp. LHD-71]|uniref:tRNA (adenosine(37)-N6)-threonylcarbamoyltransferase complex ATPase subunit type 1 TsaE n=1 Tax=Bradyrhizobium sp. LHD-71 TaxID=3072141 RepID=UPI00280CD34E|nr:tRNA (adenosine(37)-N6)-threonylcarbamoyltransferase complex ATPase subunit type 1 TsaE [Bradyrhizobium sp. LHD-71]MDQ8731922.1 tRNA (adenosine(37)-N6)-threonylcarbamoyltransferase complex ATPase subunit type 1 TsaE [Bradyrhizobium sp. LHD-71]
MTAAWSFSTDLADEAATAGLMADLGLLIGARDVITLSGDLGAGKTTAARALIRYLADDPGLEVPSPTFTLAQSYDLAPPVLHVDLYRVNDPGELDELGLAPFPDDILVLVEWPDRAGELLPADRIDIAFSQRPNGASDTRTAIITGHGTAQATVRRLASLRAFLEKSGAMQTTRKRMAGDASTRSYARLVFNGHSTILMNSPPKSDPHLIYGGKSYLTAVHLAEDIVPFVAIDKELHARGLSVPVIYQTDLEDGFLISEDLGCEGVLAGTPPAPIEERYQAAADVLVALHRSPLPTELPVENRRSYTVPAFDADAMLIEVSLLLDWYLPDRGVQVTPAMREEFVLLWRRLLQQALAVPATWVIRDFHSPNLIWLADRQGMARVGVIDFQDAVLGPPAYDVVSLAQDARVDVSEPLEIGLVSRYVRGRKDDDPSFDTAAFAESYAMMSVQRNTRLLGVFSRLNRRDGKPHYLRHRPRIWAYLNRALKHPSLAGPRAWFANRVPPPA